MALDEKVLAICVNWNGGEVLLRTLRSLLAGDYRDLRVVVVDNASAADPADDLRRLSDRIELTRLPENRGYGPAINTVLRRELASGSTPRFCLILNNDIELDPDTVSILVQEAKQHGPGIFGPKVLQFDHPERLEAAWGEVTWSHVLARFHGKNAVDGKAWQAKRPVQLLLGSALLFDTEVFKRIGLFDEQFFLYHEEVDLLFRAATGGIPTYFCPAAKVRHLGAYSSRNEPFLKTYWLRRNAVLFLRKHSASFLHWTWFWATLTLSLLFNIARLRKGRCQAILAGIRDGLQTEPATQDHLP